MERQREGQGYGQIGVKLTFEGTNAIKATCGEH